MQILCYILAVPAAGYGLLYFASGQSAIHEITAGIFLILAVLLVMTGVLIRNSPPLEPAVAIPAEPLLPGEIAAVSSKYKICSCGQKNERMFNACSACGATLPKDA